jgi:1-acyl-sn-glycerol-3-phosphate acyltransferase
MMDEVQHPTPNEKPITLHVRPEITRLPRLTAKRLFIRRLLRGLARILARLFVQAKITGLENIPALGSVLVVCNHLGDADLPLGLAFSTRMPDVFAKADLYDYPLLGRILEAYGVIWVHRGQPDRRAIRAGLQGLAEGRMLVIAPEGRESLTGALEEGTPGAAYLALKANARIIPVTFTGTENQIIYSNLKRLRRSHVTITIGTPFELEKAADWRTAVEKGTQRIMQALAAQLPAQYRGVYNNSVE